MRLSVQGIPRREAGRDQAQIVAWPKNGGKRKRPQMLLKSIGLLEDRRTLDYFAAQHRGDRSRFRIDLSEVKP